MELSAEEATAERFWSRVDRSGPCWIWTGADNGAGYGRFMWRGKTVYVHRKSFELAHGPIPSGMVVDHRCHVPACVNPDHLRLATNKQNGENRAPTSLHGRLGVRDVHYRRGLRKPYRVMVGHHGRNVSGGYFATLAEADAAATELRARLYTHDTEGVSS